jgi:hypothetical protein
MSGHIGNKTLVLLLLAVALTLPGCGRIQEAAQRAQRTNDLKAIGLAYHNYVDKYGKAPTQAGDLAEFLAGEFPRSVQDLNDGSVVFLYGVRPNEMVDGASQTVLAYDKDVPTNGGLVLLGDASVRIVTAQELQKMPQAKAANPK